ncbi:apses-type HTH transcription regulator, partial [Phycomyces blakesleeanus NRRL 1555(-)]
MSCCIYKATYSGVPVYEMLCKDASVMRRTSDSYINATHILKVAGFNKPMRTRLLEREVQLGEHEKVQGGYGKYQGSTYIPLQRATDLAKKYKVFDMLQPLLEFTKRDQSPPFTPK